MRRLTLSTKLLAAMLPLIIAVAALLGLMVRSDLAAVSDAEQAELLGQMWEPLNVALDAVATEQAAFLTTDEMAATEIEAARRATDRSIEELREATAWLSSSRAADNHLAAARSAVAAARRGIDLGVFSAEIDMIDNLEPTIGYELASGEIIAIGQLLPAEAASAELGAQLLSVVKLAEAEVRANRVIVNIEAWQSGAAGVAALQQAQATFIDLESSLSEFIATAPEDWAAQYRESDSNLAQLSGFRGALTQSIIDVEAGRTGRFDTEAFAALADDIANFQNQIRESIVLDATAAASSAQRATLIRLSVVLAAVLVAALIAALITRSVTRRIQDIASGANRVAEEQLPALVEALRDERGNAVVPDIAPLSTQGTDELAELAGSFNSLQTTLVDVANEQVEVLRRGVSDIFVTMARRNRSLIDRQLAMLDEYEAEVEDPDTLSNYYQLDHLATRMRRNSESLLVLANAEPKRRRVKATEIDDVVRASISEVEDYRRIQIEALESLQVRGNVVADVSHLLAELFDNATSFSPPGSPVRVGGRRIGDSYVIRIVDDGVGIGEERLVELNTLLREPPVIGLTASTTLGMSVISLLAAKHGITVTLSAGSPGVTVDVILPAPLFGPIEEPLGGAPAIQGDESAPTDGTVDPYALPATAVAPADATAGLDPTTLAMSSSGPNYDILKTPEPAPEPEPVAQSEAAPEAPGSYDPYDPSYDEERRVVASDLSSLSSSLAAFRSGMQSASSDQDEDPAALPGAQEPAAVAPEPSTTPDATPVAAEPVAEAPDPYAIPDATPAAPEPVAEAPDPYATPDATPPPRNRSPRHQIRTRPPTRPRPQPNRPSSRPQRLRSPRTQRRPRRRCRRCRHRSMRCCHLLPSRSRRVPRPRRPVSSRCRRHRRWARMGRARNRSRPARHDRRRASTSRPTCPTCRRAHPVRTTSTDPIASPKD